MERSEILLILVLVISLLSLWFSYKTYERKLRMYQYCRCNCGYFSEGYSDGERSGAARARETRARETRARAAIQDRERENRQQNNQAGRLRDDWPPPDSYPSDSPPGWDCYTLNNGYGPICRNT